MTSTRVKIEALRRAADLMEHAPHYKGHDGKDAPKAQCPVTAVGAALIEMKRGWQERGDVIEALAYYLGIGLDEGEPWFWAGDTWNAVIDWNDAPDHPKHLIVSMMREAADELDNAAVKV